MIYYLFFSILAGFFITQVLAFSSCFIHHCLFQNHIQKPITFIPLDPSHIFIFNFSQVCSFHTTHSFSFILDYDNTGIANDAIAFQSNGPI